MRWAAKRAVKRFDPNMAAQDVKVAKHQKVEDIVDEIVAAGRPGGQGHDASKPS